MKPLVITLHLIAFFLTGYSTNLDSLKLLLSSQNDSAKVILYNKLCLNYLYLNTDSSLKYGLLGASFAKSNHYKSGEAHILNCIGNVYLEKGDYNRSLQYYIESEKIFDNIKEIKGRLQTCMNIGYVFELQDIFEKAQHQYQMAVTLAEENDSKMELAEAFGHLGSLYYSQGNKQKSLDYFNKALDINRQINNIPRIMESLNNVAVLYQELGKYKEALENFNADLNYARQMNIKTDVIAILHNISLVYKDQKNYPKAIGYLDSSIYIAKQLRDFDDLREAYSTLSEIYKEQNNYPKALEFFQLSAAAKDSLLSQTREKQFIEMSTKYETEKKEAENKVLKAEGEKQRTINIAITGGLLLAIALAFFVFRSYRQKKKANVLLAAQNHEIKAQKHIIEEKQTEILDSISYAKRLQEAILPPYNLLQSSFKDISVFYQPKDIVAGDFYWMEKVHKDNNELTLIAAADCTGHGVPGALVSVVCSNALNRAVHEFMLTDAGQILDKTRELVVKTFAKSEKSVKDGMDISLVVIHRTANSQPTIHWAGANNPVYILSYDKITEIKADKFPVGAYINDENHHFKTHELSLNPNDRIFIFSDGLPDQFGGPENKKYKYKRLKEKLIESVNLSLNDQKQFIQQDLREWQGLREQVDDILLIGFEV